MSPAVVFNPAGPSRSSRESAPRMLSRKQTSGVVAEGLSPGTGRGFLLRVTQHDGGVQIEDQTQDRQTGRGGLRQTAAGLEPLCPGQSPRPRPSGAELGEDQIEQYPPRRGVRGDRPEQLRLSRSTAKSQIASPPFGEHHRPGPPRPDQGRAHRAAAATPQGIIAQHRSARSPQQREEPSARHDRPRHARRHSR